MAKLIKAKIAGSTLIEVLIAMVIIMVIFSIAISLFGQVMQSSISQKKIQIRNQLSLLKDRVVQKGYLQNEQVTIDSVQYFFSTKDIGTTGLSNLSILAKQGQLNCGEIQSVYKNKNRDEDEKN